MAVEPPYTHDTAVPRRPEASVAPVDVDPQSDAAPMIGAMARHTGRLGAAHPVYTALTAAAGVVTSHPEQLRVILGAERHIVDCG